MLDAIERLPTDTEDSAQARRPQDPVAGGLGAIGAWGAAPWGTTPFGIGGPASWESQRVLAASMMMAPFAAAQASALAMRKTRALAKNWRDAAARCKTMQELIEVNRAYGERAISLGAGEMWRLVERSTLMGRAAMAPQSMALRNQQVATAESEEPLLAKAG